MPDYASRERIRWHERLRWKITGRWPRRVVEARPAFADELRETNLARIAAGMDLPPELLIGPTDLDHWRAQK